MAVDTDEKRFSMMELYALDDTLPVPSGGFDAAGERQHLMGLYSGIDSTVVAGATKNYYTGAFANAKRLTRGLGW